MLDDFYKKINAVADFDLVAETMQIINQNRGVLIQLLQDQLAAGKDGNDEPVTVFDRPFYAPETIRTKKGLPGLSGVVSHITNYMHGDFYHYMKVLTEGQTFEIMSTVSYFDEIIYQSGDQIMELNRASLDFFAQNILFPKLQEAFNRKFNGL